MSNRSWWITTVLGLSGLIIIPLAQNCTFGSTTCAILASVAGGISAILGITHPGISTTDVTKVLNTIPTSKE